MALPFPDISPNIFTIPALKIGSWSLGPLPIRWYALAYIAGILLGWRYAVGLVKNQKIWRGATPVVTPLQIDDLILWITFGVILGGRIGYILFYMLPLTEARQELMAHPAEVFEVWHGGMSFHGGFIGVSLAILGFALSHRLNILKLADIVAPCVPIGLFFGRIANFINGELWGRVTHIVPWGMVFCNHRLMDAAGNCPAGLDPRHPSQLYEAGLEGLILFLILRFVTHRAGWLRYQGAVTGLFLLFYGAFRISLENVRMPDAGLQNLPFGLTVGMMLSVPMVVGGAYLIWRGLKTPPETPIAAHEPT